MLNQKQLQFQMKALLLGSKLSGLWLFTYQALTLGATPERLDLIRRALSEVNQLHGEMFPEFEHALYGDEFFSLLEDPDRVTAKSDVDARGDTVSPLAVGLPKVQVVRAEDLDPQILRDLGTQLTVDADQLQALDDADDWNRAQQQDPPLRS